MRGYLTRHTVICAVLLFALLGALVHGTLFVAGTSAQAAGESTWAKIYRGDTDLFGSGILRMPSGDLVALGTAGGRLLVTTLSPEGEVRWSQTYDHGVAGGVSGDIGAFGIPCSPSGMLILWDRTLFRLNDSGSVRWARNYYVYEPSDALRRTEFTDAVQLPDGGFVACGQKNPYQVFLCRLDRNGTPLWTKAYDLGAAGRPRVFSLASGGFLLAGSTPEDELVRNHGIKLLWLNADGKVLRSQAYLDATIPESSYGQLVDAAMTPAGPVVCQWRYSAGCFGTTVIQLNNAGAVQWSTWVGGLRKGNADAGHHSVAPAPDGSLLLAGATTEFSEHSDWGFDGMAEKLSASGDVQWVTTIDREVFWTKSGPEGVVAMDDGGLAWAATSNMNTSADYTTDLFIIRLGPGGTAGRLGSYQTQVDIGNAKLVRIEHPEITSQTSTRDSRSVTCEFEEADTDPQDTTLTGSDVEGEALSTLTLRPLYPDDAGTASSIMQGGTLYRYYRVLDANGKPVSGAEIRYRGPFQNKTMTATSDASGELVFSFVVPRSVDAQHFSTTLSIDRVRVNGRRAVLAGKPDFATDVLPLSWSTNWMMGNGIAGKVGLGVGAGVFGAAQQMAGLVLTRTAADPANDGNGSMAIGDSLSSEAAIGVQGEAGKIRLGTVQAKAADASAKASLGTFIDFATAFDEPSECSISEKLMAALTLLVGVEQVVSGGTTTMMSVAESAIVSALSDDVTMEHLTGGVSIGISGDVSALALELAKKESSSGTTQDGGRSLSGVSLGKLGAGERALLSITAYPGLGEASGKAAVEMGASFSIAEALGYQLAGWGDASAVSAELVVDPLGTSFERLVLSTSTPADDRGESQETRLTIDRAVVGEAADAVLAEVLPLAPVLTAQPDARLMFTKEFCGQVLQNVVTAVASVQVPYEHVVTKDKNPTAIEVGLGVNVLGNEVDLCVKPTWGRYKSFPVERGLFIALDDQLHLGRMVKLEEYPASLFSSQVDELPDVLAELLEVVADILSEVWDVATGMLSSSAGTLLEVGAGAGGAALGGASALFEAGTSLVQSPLGADAGTLLAFSPALARTGGVGAAGGTAAGAAGGASGGGLRLAATSTKKVTLIGTPAGEGGFCAGGIYLLEPETAVLSRPATLTLRYSAETASKNGAAALSIYHYDAANRVWTPVDSMHDPAARTLTATITQMGGYCIGSDGDAPAFTLLLPSGTPAAVTSPTPQLVVGCAEDGAGLVPSTFTATLDGKPLPADWSPSAGCALLTVADPLTAGTHSLAVAGSDGSGNSSSATFEFGVRLPPGQAVLRLTRAGAERVDLEIESGPGDTSPAAYDIWRTGPGPGTVYRRLGTVSAGAASPATAATQVSAYADSDVLAGTSYRYIAVALSGEGVEALPSEPLTVATPHAPGTEATGATEPTGSSTTSGPGKPTTSTSQQDAGATAETTEGTPPWVWFVVGAAVVIVATLAAAALLIRHRRPGGSGH